ncbi:WXG100 family type VII secretion target [Paenibacillus xylanexedens]|uniref:WXG100 family type VII secretion target n=1 Tax=Paenibacillus xylanexedens TaxID=528191 RepID=UPI001C8EBE28|nr:WXG100 family type VII secretion target [Paenibacillus xylanexedens]MBY0117733.1 WXG100 family type VII secretion target [Paenibacillus xylanexedens]
MSTIKVTPEQLHHVSNQVDQARQQLEHIREELTRQIMFLQQMWLGVTQEHFYDEFARSRPVLQKALESMVNTSMELKDIATRFENVDAEKVSLGSAVSALVAGVMMKTSRYYAGSDDKGYRMAQVNMFGKLMWMPVNENGVTDQAALQAYKKDQGHLDINRMQAVTAEPSGEDIFAMQIKSFEMGIDPFTGEPVSDKYAQMMLTSLKFSQLFMAFQMVRGSMPGGKGPFRVPSSHPAVAKIKKNLEAAEARKTSNIKGMGKDTYTGGRNHKELDDLARDPSGGGKIEPKNINERDVGLQLEARGDLGRIIRDSQADKGAEFIDTTTGIKWDVKSFESYPSGRNGIPITNPKKGAFTIQNGMQKIHEEFAKGHDVIIDTKKMVPEHIEQLKKAIDKEGIADRILWFP